MPSRLLSQSLCAPRRGSRRSGGKRFGRAIRRARTAALATAFAASVSAFGAFGGFGGVAPAAAATANVTADSAFSIPVLEQSTTGATAPASDVAADTHPMGPGYWMAARDGGVFAFGHAGYFGSMGSSHLNAPIVSMAATSDGTGYWLTSSDGGVFAFGDAGYFGSVGSHHLNAPIVAFARTPDSGGYWVMGADGGVFAFGDAGYFGSAGGSHLNGRAVSLVPTPSGAGYWIATADGGVFAFGDAGYFGSMGGSHLNGRAVSMARTPSGAGYWIATADGGVFAFGDAPYLGSMGGTRINSSVVEVTPSVEGPGYRLVAADGGVFTFGAAGYYGSTGSRRLNASITTSVEALVPAQQPGPASISSQWGYDISWPQCAHGYPSPPYGVAIVGVTGGRPFTSNPCLASQWRWAGANGSAASVYMNVSGGQPAGGPAYAWGRSSAIDAMARARAAGVSTPMWWLDVELGNSWSVDRNANAEAVQGAIDAIRGEGLAVGVYSTSLQWRAIVGGYAPGLPVWVAGASSASAPQWCDGSHGFGGGPTWLVQVLPAAYDADWVCPVAQAEGQRAFSLASVPPAPILTTRPANAS